MKKDIEKELFKSIKSRREELSQLLSEVESEWKGEDGFYRFYHQSFKVFYLKPITQQIVTALQSLVPNVALNTMFMSIIEQGAGPHVEFHTDMNSDWLNTTPFVYACPRHVVEAFLHAKTMLSLAVKYGYEFHNNNVLEPPSILPTGWATLLYLFNIR